MEKMGLKCILRDLDLFSKNPDDPQILENTKAVIPYGVRLHK